MEFRRARREEAEETLQLYRSLIGTEYCVWTENYPTEREVEFDLSRNALFCLYERMPEPDERERLIGTISIDDDPEVEALSCWSEDLTPVQNCPDWEWQQNIRIAVLPGSCCRKLWRN